MLRALEMTHNNWQCERQSAAVRAGPLVRPRMWATRGAPIWCGAMAMLAFGRADPLPRSLPRRSCPAGGRLLPEGGAAGGGAEREHDPDQRAPPPRPLPPPGGGGGGEPARA